MHSLHNFPQLHIRKTRLVSQINFKLWLWVLMKKEFSVEKQQIDTYIFKSQKTFNLKTFLFQDLLSPNVSFFKCLLCVWEVIIYVPSKIKTNKYFETKFYIFIVRLRADSIVIEIGSQKILRFTLDIFLKLIYVLKYHFYVVYYITVFCRPLQLKTLMKI